LATTGKVLLLESGFETTCDQDDFLLEASQLLGAEGEETAIGSKEWLKDATRRHLESACEV
jgi:hypothetical protein